MTSRPVDGLGREHWPESTVVVFFIFVICNIALFNWTISTMCNTSHRKTRKNDEKRKHLEADAKLLELGDMKKQ
jgi:hypothetical protein